MGLQCGSADSVVWALVPKNLAAGADPEWVKSVLEQRGDVARTMDYPRHLTGGFDRRIENGGNSPKSLRANIRIPITRRFRYSVNLPVSAGWASRSKVSFAACNKRSAASRLFSPMKTKALQQVGRGLAVAQFPPGQQRSRVEHYPPIGFPTWMEMLGSTQSLGFGEVGLLAGIAFSMTNGPCWQRGCLPARPNRR